MLQHFGYDCEGALRHLGYMIFHYDKPNDNTDDCPSYSTKLSHHITSSLGGKPLQSITDIRTLEQFTGTKNPLVLVDCVTARVLIQSVCLIPRHILTRCEVACSFNSSKKKFMDVEVLERNSP